MAIDVPVAAPPAAPASTTTSEATFDQRWAGWQAKGAAHDRAVRRKMALAAPIVIIVAAVIIYVLLAP
jgi:hypothetical protein